MLLGTKGHCRAEKKKGITGPYRDTARVESHKKYVKKFLEEGKAYQCYCTKEELEVGRKESESRGMPYHYPGTCRNLMTPPPGKTPQVIRLRMPDETISFDDMVRGTVSVKPSELDDFAIARTSGDPLYNFSVAIDDYEMKISHVIRGEDHISNTPKQIAVFRALGVPAPRYGHIPLILNADRSKMSKRFADTSLASYRNQGYLPGAIVNFLALLGWHPKDDREVLSLDELAHEFDISRVQKAGAVFDQNKLDWLNREYLKKMSDEEIAVLLAPFWEDSGIANRVSPIGKESSDARCPMPDRQTLLKLIAVGRGRANTLRDFIENGKSFFILPEYDAGLLVWKKMPSPTPEIAATLTTVLEALQKTNGTFMKKEISDAVDAAVQGRQKGEIFWPLRVALSGQQSSPDPIDIMDVIGKEESLRRITAAIEKCRGK